MKIFVVFVSVLIATAMAQIISVEQMESVMHSHKECQEETGISDALAAGVVTGNFPDDPVLKSHLLCVHKKLGFQDGDGNLQMDLITSTMKSVLPAADIQGMVDTCVVQKDTPEDTAIEMDRCLYQMVKGK